MTTETITLIFNYGVPLGILICIGVFVWKVAWPDAMKRIDKVLADHMAVIQELNQRNDEQRAQNDKQREQHLAFEQRQRTEYLDALKSTNDKQMQVLSELLRIAQSTAETVDEIRDDWRAWNGIERRRVNPTRKTQP